MNNLQVLSVMHMVLLAIVGSCEGQATAPIIGNPTVALPGSRGAVLTGITMRYRERRFLDITKNIDAYLGVQYGVAPTGDLRFADPIAFEISGSYNATADRAICAQFSIFGYNLVSPFPDLGREVSEDCLYLSIYTPSPKPSNPVPVMVWIHGGGNTAGSGSSPVPEPLPLVAMSDIVVVNVNYRLGVFGFLTTGDDVATGNYGLMDQVLSLRWVQNNIAAFGGDPLRVTVAGESAGGSSVGQHMLSPLSRGLFHQAIMQSGNAVCPWTTTTVESAAVHHRALAVLVGCPTDDSQAMVDCMRQVNETELVKKSSSYLNGTVSSPVIDGRFMPYDPQDMVKRRDFQVIPTLIGSNKDEMEAMGLFLDLPSSIVKRPTMNISTFRNLLPVATQNVHTAEQMAAVENQYVDWSVADNATADQLDGFVTMLTDEYFACPTDNFARALQAAGAPVYRYELTHDPAWSVFAGIPNWLGAVHGEDLQYVFAWGLSPTLGRIVGQTDEEKAMSVEFIRYWTNFVKSGNPNEPMTSVTYPAWPKYTMPEQAYKQLSLNMTNGRALRAADCHFWLNTLPRLYIHTAPLAELQDDWNEQYELWRNEDIPDWKLHMDDYKEENVCPGQPLAP